MPSSTRRHRSIALDVGAQIELTLGQVDVLGCCQKVHQAEGVGTSAIAEYGRKRRPGLRFEDFAEGRLDVGTSKRDVNAVFDVTMDPLFQQALAVVPATTDGDENRSEPTYYLALTGMRRMRPGVPRLFGTCTRDTVEPPRRKRA